MIPSRRPGQGGARGERAAREGQGEPQCQAAPARRGPPDTHRDPTSGGRELQSRCPPSNLARSSALSDVPGGFDPRRLAGSTSRPGSACRGDLMGKHDNDIVQKASEHVFELFRSAKPEVPLVYHGFRRTRELVDACKDVAKGCKLADGDVDVVLLAAWFHDAGYAAGFDADRRRSVEICREFLVRHEGRKSLADRV